MTEDGPFMSPNQIRTIVLNDARDHHDHNAGFTIFGWSFRFGIYKNVGTSGHRRDPEKKVWWN